MDLTSNKVDQLSELHVKYSDNIYKFAYGHGGQSEKPIVDISNLTFYSDNQNLLIDSDGIITFNKKTNYGLYESTIYYSTLDKIINNKTTIKYCIYPVVNYYTNKIIIEYGNYYETNNPEISNNIFLRFFINEINGIRINKDTGKLYFNENYNLSVDNYIITINYIFCNIIFNVTLLIDIIPTFKYTENIITINDPEKNFISSKPIVNPINGTFSILNNNNFIINDDGVISSNNLNIGNYKITIQYKYNNIINNIDYQIICNPKINYEENSYVMKFKDNGKSVKPYVYPSGGIFKIKNITPGITINKDGQLLFNDIVNIGNYNIIIIYQYNTNITSCNYNLIVESNINFPDDIFEYDNIIVTPKKEITMGTFKLLNNDFNINQNTGEITLIDPIPANYKFEINYNINNVSNDFIYNVCIKPKIIIQDKLKIKFKSDNNININVLPINGILYINGIESSDFFIITEKLDIGEYSYNIDYVYNNIKTSKTITFIIESNIYYEYKEFTISENNCKLEPCGIINGNFISDDLNIDINGNILINHSIGKYSYIIKHKYNNIITNIEVNFDVIPKFYYSINNIINNYGKKYISNPPIIDLIELPYFFTFDKDYNFISIDKSNGIIIIDENLKLGDYQIMVNLNIDKVNIVKNIIINIQILPDFYYDNVAYTYFYTDKVNINKPIVNPFSNEIKINNILIKSIGNFSCNNLPNNIILNDDGSLYSIDNLEVGQYDLNIIYNFSNNRYKGINNIILTIVVKPSIKYLENKSTIIYGNYFESKLPLINSHSTGKFLINEPHQIDLEGKFILDSSLSVDNHNINISYELNNILHTITFLAQVIPKIIIEQDTYEFNYLEENIIKEPYVNPTGGYYTLDKNIDGINVDKNTGRILITDCLVDQYDIKLIYCYNSNHNFVNYNIIIKPVIKYIDIPKYIIFNSNFIISPITYPNNGTFSNDLQSETKYFTLFNGFPKSGYINCNKFKVGNYCLEIIYEYNKISSSCIINFEIIPKIFYLKTEYEINFNDNVLSEIPILEPNNIDLILNDDKIENGQIDFSNYEVGIHNLNIKYGKNESNINLTVKPIVKYINEVIMNYNDPIKITPEIINNNGIFSCNDLDIIIDKNTGIIDLENIYPTEKIIIINYELNNVSISNNIKIICNPQIIYSIQLLNLNYLEKINNKPILKPNGGKISCNNLCDGILLDEITGEIQIINPYIGEYEFNIDYVFNNLSSKTTISLNVKPICNYNGNDIFYYSFKNKSRQPIYNPPNGKFYCDKFQINNNGEIIINENVDVGIYNINIQYAINNKIVQTKYSFEIIPFILYYYSVLYYGIEKISPYIYPLGGIFKIINDIPNIIINDIGEIFIDNLEPNNYIINIEYIYNNKSYYSTCKLLIKPYLNYKDKLEYLPLNGKLEISNRFTTLNSDNIGIYDLIFKYTYNNITSYLNLNLDIIPNKLYDNDIYYFYTKEVKYIFPIINFGNFNLKYNIDNINLSENGNITINNCNVGNYKLSIIYSSNNLVKIYEITIIIKPKILYSNYINSYGFAKIIPTYFTPNNGIFKINNNFKNIKLNDNGIINITNAYPNNYKLDIDYIVNNVTENIKFNISILPIINFDISNIEIKYNEGYISNQLKFYPAGGNFNVNYSDIKINYNYFEINKEKNVDKYEIIITYIINNQKTSVYKDLLIKPDFYYFDENPIKTNFYDKKKSLKPYVNPSGGKFSLDDNNDNITIDDDIGIITFENLDIGNYELKINYIFNNIISSTYYSIISEPVFYYDHGLTINYNNEYNITSDEPIYYPKGGKFSLNNNIDIDEDTGKINFINLDVNTYDLFVTYIINNRKLYSKFKFIVNPIINYDINNASILYNNSFVSDPANVNPNGGIFSCTNLPDGCYLNKDTGIIRIYKLTDKITYRNYKIGIDKIADKGNYILNIVYTYNNQISSTNYYLTIR